MFVLIRSRLSLFQGLEHKYGAESVQVRAAHSILTTTISFVRCSLLLWWLQLCGEPGLNL
jgi:hypothetical protein